VGTLAGGGGEDPGSEWRRLSRENARLKRQVEVASGKEFYLVLDTAASKLRLMLRGAMLREYALARVEVGRPRVLFLDRGGESRWWEPIWSAGRLEPGRERERLEIPVPEPGSEPTEPFVPPEPDEDPVPERYFVRFAGGLALEVLPTDREVDSGWRRLVRTPSRRLADVVAAVTGTTAPRLRVVLSHEDAGALYRSLPPDTKLLVL
jgi:hypothetical protein